MPNRRRAFFLLALTLLLMIALAACGGAGPEPQAAEQPAAAESETAAEEQAATEEGDAAASAGETPYGPMPADATAFPEAPEIDLGGTAVERVAIEEMVTYMALDEYHEPEWVSQLVADGVLPPLEERLPNEPQILLTSGLKDGIGEYGGSWFDFSACPTAAQPHAAAAQPIEKRSPLPARRRAA